MRSWLVEPIGTQTGYRLTALRSGKEPYYLGSFYTLSDVGSYVRQAEMVAKVLSKPMANPAERAEHLAMHDIEDVIGNFSLFHCDVVMLKDMLAARCTKCGGPIMNAPIEGECIKCMLEVPWRDSPNG